MSELKGSPLRRTRALQEQLDEFLDVVSQAALSYEAGMTQYVRHGWTDAVEVTPKSAPSWLVTRIRGSR